MEDSQKSPLPFFSVVVPVYKIPLELLRACLGSLESQRCERAEYIVVDDGSPDSCGAICDEFAEGRPAFRVVHTSNRGVSHARNVGIDFARGSYVLFVDGDDRMPADFLKQLYDARDELEEVTFYDCDADSSLTGEARQEVAQLPGPFALARSITSFSEHDLDLGRVVLGSPWGKAISLAYLRNVGTRFPEGVRKAQDRIFMVDLLSHEPRCNYLPILGYVYVQNADSVSHKYNPNAREIAGQTCANMRRVIEVCYKGEGRDEMLEALRIFRLTFFYEIVDLDILSCDNPKPRSERFADFKKVARDYSDAFLLPKGFAAPSRRIAVSSNLLARGHFRLAFEALEAYHRVRR